MRIECTVEVPRDASDISIGWFLDCVDLSNDSHVTISTQDQYTDTVHRIRSQLEITDMHVTDINNAYAGKYTCKILGDEEFIPSNLFRLPDSTELEVDLAFGTCSDGTIFSIEEVKCAEITENRTISMSLSCADPVAATSTPVIQSTSIPSLPTSTPVIHSSSVTTSHFPPLPLPTTNVPTVTDTSSSGPTIVWLYVVAAVAAVFLLIIIVMLILYVKICFSRHKCESQYI